jgi:long-chain acyl-CoA synthetase
MDPQVPNTVNDIFFAVVERDPAAPMLVKDAHRWRAISAREIYGRVLALARTLQAWGITRGDRVAIIGENRYEWAIADFACLSLGVVDVPIYPTLTAQQTAMILNDSGARIAFVSTAEQLNKLLAIRRRTALEKIVVMDDAPMQDAIAMRVAMQPIATQRDAAFDALAHSVTANDLATIIYTSGTTGTPKGVMLTHGNLASNVAASIKAFGVGERDVYVSCLPLSHIFARHIDYAMFLEGVCIAYCPDLSMLPQALRETKPTFFVAVPRIFEKLRSTVERQVARGVKQKLYRWALRTGAPHSDSVLSLRAPQSFAWKLARRLVYSKIHAALGGRVQMMISGGAPLGRELAEWYPTVGLALYEGYGLTETSPVVSRNTPADHRIGSVGKVLTNVDVRIAADGEILARGPSVFAGYWNQADETQAAFDGDWFRTGDIGSLDDDGFLYITDRKKELLKTSGGKFVAPAPIEQALTGNPLVAHAAVIGDRRRFAVAILAPHFPLLEDWAHANQVAFASRAELVQHERVQGLYHGIVEDVNSHLAQFETMKRFLLVADEFSIATGELTPTLKLKRQVVEQKYLEQIEAIYHAAEAASPEVVV